MPGVAPAVYPVADQFIGWGNETTPGTPVVPAVTIPVNSFTPKDNITMLEDTGFRNAMADLFGLIPGTEIGDISLGGDVYGDTIGYPLMNVFGDYFVSAMTSPGTASTPAAAYAAGTSAISVTAGSLTLNTPYLFYTGAVTAGSLAEVVVPVSGTGVGPYTLKQPLYYSHGTTASSIVASTPGTSVFTHRFSLLNNGKGGGGWANTQPRTNTLTQWTGITATSGARSFPFACLSEMTMTGTSTALLLWDGKITSFASAPSGATPTAAPSSVAAQPSWNAPTFKIGGTQVNDIAEWKLTLARVLSPKFTVQGSQQAYTIARGPLRATMALAFDPAVDESALLYYLNNTQPTVQIQQSNGAVGVNLVTVEVDIAIAAFDASALNDTKVVFGYDNTLKCVNSVGSTLMPIGPSGGYTPVSVAVTNAVPSY